MGVSGIYKGNGSVREMNNMYEQTPNRLCTSVCLCRTVGYVREIRVMYEGQNPKGLVCYI